MNGAHGVAVPDSPARRKLPGPAPNRPAPSGRASAWKRLLTLGGLVLLVGFAHHSSAQTTARDIVGDVAVVGNRSIPTEKVLRYITRTRPGQDYTPAGLQADVDSLTEAKLFKNVRVRDQRGPDGKITVYFEVTEYPSVITEIIYRNAHHISEKDLNEMTRLRKGMPLNPTMNRQACYEIQDHLKRKGRYFANVVLEEGDKPGDSRVVFNIAEGPIVRIRDIRFEGHKELATAARLKTQIDTSKAFLGLLGGVFNPAQIDNDVIKLEDYYKDNGYIHVRVSRELIFSDDFRYVDIVFHIHEGQRHRIEDVQVEGTKTMDRVQVGSIVQAKKGEFLNGGVVQADMRNITDYYGWRGYPAVVSKEVFTVPDKPGLVRIQYEIKERPPAKVGQVIIVGNEVTQDRVIRRVLGLYPGQTLRYPELRIAEKDLARLNIFKLDPENGIRPTVSVLDPEGDSEYKDILVQVQETQTGSLLFGAGFNSNAGLVGSIVLNERNFDLFRFPTSLADIFEGRAWRGAGQEFRLEAVPGTQLQRYSATWREPFLFDRPYSLTISGYYNDRIYNEYTDSRYGTRLSVGHALTKNWTINTGVRVENVDVHGLSFFSPPDYTSVQGNNFVVAPNIGVQYDTRDSFLRPTEGGLITASFEQVLGDFTVPIFNIEGSRYFTTWQRPDGSGKHVLALRSQASWASDNCPVFERFFAGGFSSIRGFQFRGVGPFVNGEAVGGTFMFLNSLEYQVPIRANDQLYLVGFLDSGTVESRTEIKDYRVSAGVGLRIVVPMMGPVPIALDFGFPIVRGPNDREQVFSFYVGLFR